MKALLPLLIVLLLSASKISAQETPEATDWTTEERCITAPSQPPEGWTYDGVIFTFKPGDGVHARRADVATPYYVAFDTEDEYAWAGRLSPDGRWFALTYGAHWDEHATSLDNQYHIQEIRVYSTAPNRELFRVSANWVVAINAKDTSGIFVQWLDDQHILYPMGYDVGIGYFEWTAINPFTGETRSYDGAMPLSLSQRAIEFGIPPEVLPNIVIPVSYYRPLTVNLSADNQHFAFLGEHSTIHIGNVATHHIVDTCVRPEFPQASFSPDGRQLAFGLEPAGYVYILDIEMWEAYRIDLAAADVIGWYPLE